MNQPWQSEALCEYSLLRFIQEKEGASARRDYEEREILSTHQITMASGISCGAPASYFSSAEEYTLAVQKRGAELLTTLEMLFPSKLDTFLKEYYNRYRYGRASRQDFEELLQSVTGEDIRVLMMEWLDVDLSE